MEQTFGISNYSLGQKYCRRCEVYMYSENAFCPCCGIQLSQLQVVGGVKKYSGREGNCGGLGRRLNER